MSSLITDPRTLRPPSRVRLSPHMRKIVLVTHIAAAGSWLGLDLVLGILVGQVDRGLASDAGARAGDYREGARVCGHLRSFMARRAGIQVSVLPPAAQGRAERAARGRRDTNRRRWSRRRESSLCVRVERTSWLQVRWGTSGLVFVDLDGISVPSGWPR